MSALRVLSQIRTDGPSNRQLLWAQFLIGFGMLSAPSLLPRLFLSIPSVSALRFYYIPLASTLQWLPLVMGLLWLLILSGEPIQANGIGRVVPIRVAVAMIAGGLVLVGLGWVAAQSLPGSWLASTREYFPVELKADLATQLLNYFLPVFLLEFVRRAFLQTRLELLLKNPVNALLAMVALDVLAVCRSGFDDIRFEFLFSLTLGASFLYSRCAWVPAILAGSYSALYLVYVVNR